jgi:hypothetical protein
LLIPILTSAGNSRWMSALGCCRQSDPTLHTPEYWPTPSLLISSASARHLEAKSSGCKATPREGV